MKDYFCKIIEFLKEGGGSLSEGELAKRFKYSTLDTSLDKGTIYHLRLFSIKILDKIFLYGSKNSLSYSLKKNDECRLDSNIFSRVRFTGYNAKEFSNLGLSNGTFFLAYLKLGYFESNYTHGNGPLFTPYEKGKEILRLIYIRDALDILEMSDKEMNMSNALLLAARIKDEEIRERLKLLLKSEDDITEEIINGKIRTIVSKAIVEREA